MMTLASLHTELESKTFRWLITGGAGFIGSHLTEFLLSIGNQLVTVIDNFATGSKDNIELFCSNKNFKFIEGDILNCNLLKEIITNVDIILHQAALGSVPRSIEFPELYIQANIVGTFNIFNEVRKIQTEQARKIRIVYASSSSVYGDIELLPKVEEIIGSALSPYALSKQSNEQWSQIYKNLYNVESVGLRYFNVFGPRQNPNGDYAAVIPKWISEIKSGKNSTINGDGKTSRDFCFVSNVVQANIKAALTHNTAAFGKAYNVGVGDQTTLTELYSFIKELALPEHEKPTVHYGPFRAGDVRHSRASITNIVRDLGYVPEVYIKEGLAITVEAMK